MQHVLIVLVLFLLAPDRPPPWEPTEPDPPRTAPMIAGPCCWGVVLQDGCNIWVTGHCDYEGWGAFCPDGFLHLTWPHLRDGRLSYGVYEMLPCGAIKGEWGDKKAFGPAGVGGLHWDTLRGPAKE